ncbi:MAG: BatA domain-containing protein [Planctomycetota bacterium]
MSFAAPFALFALLAVPVVLALHLFRRRYQPRRVAGVFLFAPDAMTARAGRTRTPLVRSPSLWLELAAAAALALWLAGPRLFAFGEPTHLVVVLDDSASMAARGRDGATFAERARRAVRAAATAAGRDAVVTLVRSGPRPTVWLGPRAPMATLDHTLAAYAPKRTHHDVEAALGLARELGGRDATLLFVTDGEAESPPRGFAQRSVGEPLANAAIAHARRVRRDGGERLFVDLLAFAPATMSTELTVREVGTDAVVATRRVELANGKVARFELDLPASDAALEVRLGEDALALDSSCLLLAEPVRRVRIGVRLPAEAARALELGHAVRALGETVALAVGDDADLLVRDASGTAAGAEAVVEVVVAPGAEPVEAWVGPFLLDKRHPLLRGISLEGVVWSAGQPAAPGRGLVFAGERALLAEEHLDGERLRVTLDLAPARSNLTTSPDWPILLSNLVAAARARLAGAAQVNVRLGDAITWRRRRADEGQDLRLLGPSGAASLGVGSRVVTFEPVEAGEHRLLRGDEEQQRFAVNFVDARESDLRTCAAVELAAEPLPVADVEAKARAEVRGERERQALALLLLLLVALDWLVLAPRTGAEARA